MIFEDAYTHKLLHSHVNIQINIWLYQTSNWEYLFVAHVCVLGGVFCANFLSHFFFLSLIPSILLSTLYQKEKKQNSSTYIPFAVYLIKQNKIILGTLTYFMNIVQIRKRKQKNSKFFTQFTLLRSEINKKKTEERKK